MSEDLGTNVRGLTKRFLPYLHFGKVKVVRSRRNRTPRAPPTNLHKQKKIQTNQSGLLRGTPDLGIP